MPGHSKWLFWIILVGRMMIYHGILDHLSDSWQVGISLVDQWKCWGNDIGCHVCAGWLFSEWNQSRSELRRWSEAWVHMVWIGTWNGKQISKNLLGEGYASKLKSLNQCSVCSNILCVDKSTCWIAQGTPGHILTSHYLYPLKPSIW